MLTDKTRSKFIQKMPYFTSLLTLAVVAMLSPMLLSISSTMHIIGLSLISFGLILAVILLITPIFDWYYGRIIDAAQYIVYGPALAI